ncbi:hypothetical protein CROQUDRAFT_51562 [Cronartium quercuum f. sp. fusiforme G11]|uniref:Uncharacterized protein n=1 Tax=Cronartium quercuum f. sp. fusiforme G11 TaxID=708437 RepID=A0A9P6NC35_9BASI|nr:hypothetical protein CROQUDRAFT_51562 [Cronartium quercuum f. sp. fusiforme G11]
MFFSTDLLSKRHQSGLGIYWLAATVASSSKSTITKLTKKEVINADLFKACTTLAHPPEPLALRLTSGLLLGITRVYGQQWSLFYLDVQQASQSIRKAFSSIIEAESAPQHPTEAGPVTSNEINLPRGNVRLDAITITRKKGENIDDLFNFQDMDPFMFPPFVTGISYDQELERELGRGVGITRIIPHNHDQEEEDWDQENLDQRQRSPPDRFMSKPADIDLVELENYQMNPHPGPQNFWGDQSSFEAGLEVDAFDVGAGLLAGINPELDANFGIMPPNDDIAQGSATGQNGQDPIAQDYISQRGAASYVLRGSIADPFENQDHMQLDNEDARPPVRRARSERLPPPFDETKINQHQPQVESRPSADVFSHRTLDSINTQDAFEINQAADSSKKRADGRQPDGPGVRASKRARNTMITIDPTTSLTAEKLREMRDGYGPGRYRRLREVNEKLRARKAKEKVRELLFGVPNSIRASELAGLWKSSVKLLPTFTNTNSKANDEIADEIMPLREEKNHEPSAIALSRREKSQRSAFGGRVGSEHDIGGVGQETGFEGEITSRADFGFQTPWDPSGQDGQMESGRGMAEGDLERPIELYEDVIGRHRAGSYEGSPQAQGLIDMPWNKPIQGRASELGRQSEQGANYFEDAIDQVSGGGRSTTQFSGETPVPMRVGRHSSVLSSIHDSALTPHQGRPELNGADEVGELKVFLADQQLEQDSLNFLEWTKTQVRNQGDFLFSDLAPVIATSGPVAAQAFHKVLSLATKDLVRVLEQDEPYGEVGNH